MKCRVEACKRELTTNARDGLCWSCYRKRQDGRLIEPTETKRVVEKPATIAVTSYAESPTMQVSLPREPWREE
jgi:hypothetical protein